jgi:uncharacterized protein (TIGR00369 family)
MERTYSFVPEIDPRRYAGLTGLEALKKIAEGAFPPPPMASTMAMSLVEIELCRAVFDGEPGPWALNPLGTVHGGFAATLLDSALACAVHSTLPVDSLYTTLSLELKLVRAITPKTGKVRAEGKVVHSGGRTATAEGRIIALEGGKLLATATTTCLIMPLESR